MKPQTAATAAAKGSPKGEETRRRILDAAMTEFSVLGFAGTSTRRIAELAVVNLPALRYYFGGKEGLYLACAQAVMDEYQAGLQALQSELTLALANGMTPPAARASLKALLRALVDVQVGAQQSDIWLRFVQREVAEQGPAYRLFFDGLWMPGIDLAAALIGRILGQPARTEPVRMRALMLISSFAAFGVARPIALEYLDWRDLSPDHLERIKRAFDEQVEQIR